MSKDVDADQVADAAAPGGSGCAAGPRVDRAGSRGGCVAGRPDGLLAGITCTVLQTALDAEMTEHPGYEKGDPAGRGSCRNTPAAWKASTRPSSPCMPTD
jgi:hypothetical protein